MEGTVLEGMTPRSKAGARRQTDNQHTVHMKVQETEKKNVAVFLRNFPEGHVEMRATL